MASWTKSGHVQHFDKLICTQFWQSYVCDIHDGIGYSYMIYQNIGKHVTIIYNSLLPHFRGLFLDHHGCKCLWANCGHYVLWYRIRDFDMVNLYVDSVWWTRLVFQIPQPVRLSSHQCLLPDMTQHPGDQPCRLELQREDPGLHRDLPGCLSDGSGCPWDEPGVAASPENPDHVLHSLDPCQ